MNRKIIEIKNHHKWRCHPALTQPFNLTQMDCPQIVHPIEMPHITEQQGQIYFFNYWGSLNGNATACNYAVSFSLVAKNVAERHGWVYAWQIISQVPNATRRVTLQYHWLDNCPKHVLRQLSFKSRAVVSRLCEANQITRGSIRHHLREVRHESA